MSWWDRTHIRKLQGVGWDAILYERYVNGITMCIKSSEPGAKYQDDKLVIDETLKENEELIPEDKTIGESIHKV